MTLMAWLLGTVALIGVDRARWTIAASLVYHWSKATFSPTHVHGLTGRAVHFNGHGWRALNRGLCFHLCRGLEIWLDLRSTLIVACQNQLNYWHPKSHRLCFNPFWFHCGLQDEASRHCAAFKNKKTKCAYCLTCWLRLRGIKMCNWLAIKQTFN